MRTHPLILNVDLAGAAAVLAIAAGAVFLWLRPAMDRSRRITDLHADYKAALTQLDQTEAQRRKLDANIEAARATLAELGGGPPRARELDAGIKQVVALATNSGLQVDGIRPVAHRERNDWDEYQFEIKATGSFPEFHRFCRVLEDKADFVDVPEYRIEHTGPPGRGRTKMSCAVRFYALPDVP